MSKRECNKCGQVVDDIKDEAGLTVTIDVIKRTAVQADTSKLYKQIKVYTEHKC